MSKQSNSGNEKNFKPGDRVRFNGRTQSGLVHGSVYTVCEVDFSGFPTVIDDDGDYRDRGKDEWEKVEDAAKAPTDAAGEDLTGEGSPGASGGVEASGGAVTGRDTVTLERMTLAQWQEKYSDCVGHWAESILRDLGLVKEEGSQDVAVAREICAEVAVEKYNPDLGQRLAEHFRAGAYDDGSEMTIALRALEKGKQSC